MEHGGRREGAGRKRGAANLLTRELRDGINAKKLIQFLEDLAGGKFKNASISERKDAAVALLRKVMPDCKSVEIERATNRPYVIQITPEHAQRVHEAAIRSRNNRFKS